MNPDLLDMAGDDPCRARAIQQLLTKLVDGPNPVLREMATGVLNGDVTLRDAAASSAYSDAIAGRFDTFWQRYETLTPDEHDDLLADGHRFIEETAMPQPGRLDD